MSDDITDTGDGANALESLEDPASLFEYAGVDVEELRESVDAEDFEAAETWDSHVAVGVADDRGVLLYDDGHHGWTLPAFPVADDEDYLAVAQREFETVTGVELAVDGVEHARRRVFHRDDGEDETDVWNVVVRATPATALPDAPTSRADGATVRWFDGIPDSVEGIVAADIERVAN